MISSRLSVSILAACVWWSAPAHSQDTVDLSANAFMPGCRYVIERGGTATAREIQLVYDGGRCNGLSHPQTWTFVTRHRRQSTNFYALS